VTSTTGGPVRHLRPEVFAENGPSYRHPVASPHGVCPLQAFDLQGRQAGELSHRPDLDAEGQGGQVVKLFLRRWC